jgi:hypothetical protein
MLMAREVRNDSKWATDLVIPELDAVEESDIDAEDPPCVADGVENAANPPRHVPLNKGALEPVSPVHLVKIDAQLAQLPLSEVLNVLAVVSPAPAATEEEAHDGHGHKDNH